MSATNTFFTKEIRLSRLRLGRLAAVAGIWMIVAVVMSGPIQVVGGIILMVGVLLAAAWINYDFAANRLVAPKRGWLGSLIVYERWRAWAAITVIAAIALAAL